MIRVGAFGSPAVCVVVAGGWGRGGHNASEGEGEACHAIPTRPLFLCASPEKKLATFWAPIRLWWRWRKGGKNTFISSHTPPAPTPFLSQIAFSLRGLTHPPHPTPLLFQKIEKCHPCAHALGEAQLLEQLKSLAATGTAAAPTLARFSLR